MADWVAAAEPRAEPGEPQGDGPGHGVHAAQGREEEASEASEASEGASEGTSEAGDVSQRMIDEAAARVRAAEPRADRQSAYLRARSRAPVDPKVMKVLRESALNMWRHQI